MVNLALLTIRKYNKRSQLDRIKFYEFMAAQKWPYYSRTAHIHALFRSVGMARRPGAPLDKGDGGPADQGREGKSRRNGLTDAAKLSGANTSIDVPHA